MTNTPLITTIKWHKQSQQLELSFTDGGTYFLNAEYLRVYSPSAEVRNHGQNEGKLQVGKKHVLITNIEPVGRYAVKLSFDDGHNTGIYSFDTLYELSVNYETLWTRYLQRLTAANETREPKR